jgi:hypothetical protein
MTAGPGPSSVAPLPPLAWLRYDIVRRTTAQASVREASTASGRMRQPSGSLFGTVDAVAAVPFRGIWPMVPGEGLGSSPSPASRGSHEVGSHVVAGSMAMGCCR